MPETPDRRRACADLRTLLPRVITDAHAAVIGILDEIDPVLHKYRLVIPQSDVQMARSADLRQKTARAQMTLLPQIAALVDVVCHPPAPEDASI